MLGRSIRFNYCKKASPGYCYHLETSSYVHADPRLSASVRREDSGRGRAHRRGGVQTGRQALNILVRDRLECPVARGFLQLQFVYPALAKIPYFKLSHLIPQSPWVQHLLRTSKSCASARRCAACTSIASALILSPFSP